MKEQGQKPAPRTALKTFIRVLVILAVIWVLSALFLFTFQSKFVYHPRENERWAPRDFGLVHQDVWFETTDGVKLHGWLIRTDDPIATLLYCHGNAGNISYALEHIHALNKLGFEVFIFDYRGFGKSDGTPTEKGTYKDAKAAWTTLVENANVPSRQIVIYGRSLGGAVAAWLASQVTPGGLIVENAFISVPEAGQDIYPIFPSRFMAQFQYNTLEYVKKSRAPILVIHARDDNKIPFRHGESLFSAARAPKRFLEVSGGHGQAYKESASVYTSEIRRFVTDFIQPEKIELAQ